MNEERVSLEELDVPGRWKQQPGRPDGYDPVPEFPELGGAAGQVRVPDSRIVYQLTTVKLADEDTPEYKHFKNTRTPGVFSSLPRVHVALQENMGDMYEAGHYPMAIVEAVVLDGLYLFSKNRIWYCWDEHFEGYRPCEEPAGFEHLIALGAVG